MIRMVILWSLVLFSLGCSQNPAQQAEKRPGNTSPDATETPSSDRPSTEQKALANKKLQALFEKLDEFGLNKVRDAKFVELEFSDDRRRSKSRVEKAWLLSQDDQSIVVLQDDLIPWTYNNKSPTTVPSSWFPASVRQKSVKDANFEKLCQEMSKPVEVDPEGFPDLHAPGPSHRLLMAHAAWKHGLSEYVEPILSAAPAHEEGFAAYQAAVLEDLAWLHFLRGVNLLMFADRREVLPHLRLVSKLSPDGEYAADAGDLLVRLERLIEEEPKEKSNLDETKLSNAEKARLYVSQLKSLCCSQTGQPGDIDPYIGVVNGKLERTPPTLKLKQLGMDAVPALIEALEFETPTRTVYHWRDFHRSRLVWRVSDFAWTVLRDITHKDFGNRLIVGFTFGSMPMDEKRRVIQEIKTWYAESRNLSADDRMFTFFSSPMSEDWITAANYFVKKQDNRAVKPLLEKIRKAQPFTQGELCELVARFGDPSAKDVIGQVMITADEASDRLSAAIALWTLGDDSGIPVAIDYVKASEQPYGGWEEPIWFLVRVKTKESLDALESVVTNAEPKRAGEVVEGIIASIIGNFWGEEREPAGCAEICPVLIAAMSRAEPAGLTINGVKLRVKDRAATGIVVLREGRKDSLGGPFMLIHSDLFNETEPDEKKKDAQIDALKKWYKANKDRLIWDSKANRLVVKEDSP